MDIDEFAPSRSSRALKREALPLQAHDDVRMVSSTDIFRSGEHEIAIFHGDAVYSLKITKLGKLVLNK
ncbi:hemin uptake protein HemP [Mesorhizobium sp. ASY16-5R]|uniref:hemin uptake protein HemP n=1 Tax=Mesorhizobium sp. ASY16-5R TaxID=3445772 RepID=UPI003FA094E8